MRRMQGLFALMSRALRVDDRSLRTHLLRLLFMGFTYFMLVVVYRNSRYDDAPGLHLFVALCFVDFFFIVLASVGLFASAITEEKEEMTLGLLRMAGVNGVTLLVGKFVPRFVLALILLLAQIPFVMLAITLGGVALPQIVGAYVVLLSFLLFVSALGLFCSVISPRSQAASMLATAILALYFFGPPLLDTLVQGCVEAGWLASESWVVSGIDDFKTMVMRTSAFQKLIEFASTGGSRSNLHAQSISNVLMGVVLFGAACWAYGPCTRDESPPAPPRPLTLRNAKTRRAGMLAPNRAWTRAVVWKDFHFHAGGYSVLGGQVVICLVVLACMLAIQWRYGDEIHLGSYGAGLVGGGTLGLLILGGVLSSRFLADEVKWRTLTSLLLVPQSPVSLVISKVAGAYMVTVPSACFVLLGFVLMYFDEDRWSAPSRQDILMISWCAVQYLMFIHLAAWVSLYVKWGALPVAVGTWGMLLFSIGFMTQSDRALVVVGGLLAVIVMPIVQWAIVERFRALGSE